MSCQYKIGNQIFNTEDEVINFLKLQHPSSFLNFLKYKLDTQQTVARKYEEIAQILKAERGDNFEIVTDDNGFDWYETKLATEEINNPVTAFQINATEQELQQIKNEAIANGTFMKAPNGKDTNLNERQWLQVRSKNFRSWFGDFLNDPQNASKVVDENGEPMVVYHFTEENFYSFDKNLLGEKTKDGDIGIHASSLLGFWFNNNKDFYKSIENEYNIQKVFLNITDIKNINNLHDLWGTLQRITEDTSETYNDNGEDFEDDIEYKSSQEIADIYLEDYISYEDGIVIKNDTEFGGNSFIVFEPDQIKSATDNVGTFSSETNDIRYQIQPLSGAINDILETYPERELQYIAEVLNITTPTIQDLITSGEVTYQNEDGQPCAKIGAKSKFEKGHSWKVVKTIEGNSHESGGVDIELSDKGIKVKRNNSEIKAENGLVIKATR